MHSDIKVGNMWTKIDVIEDSYIRKKNKRKYLNIDQ